MATLLEQSNLDPYVSSLQSAAERPLSLDPPVNWGSSFPA